MILCRRFAEADFESVRLTILVADFKDPRFCELADYLLDATPYSPVSPLRDLRIQDPKKQACTPKTSKTSLS